MHNVFFEKEGCFPVIFGLGSLRHIQTCNSTRNPIYSPPVVRELLSTHYFRDAQTYSCTRNFHMQLSPSVSRMSCKATQQQINPAEVGSNSGRGTAFVLPLGTNRRGIIALSLPLEDEGQRSFVARQALTGDTDKSAGAADGPQYKMGISSVVTNTPVGSQHRQSDFSGAQSLNTPKSKGTHESTAVQFRRGGRGFPQYVGSELFSSRYRKLYPQTRADVPKYLCPPIQLLSLMSYKYFKDLSLTPSA